VSGEIYLEAMIEQVQIYAVRYHIRVNMEALIKRVWSGAWKPWCCEYGDMHMEATIV